MQVAIITFSFVVFFILAFDSLPALAGLPGGLSDADENDETIVEMANFAVGELGSEYTLIKIKKAQTQVVAGTMYHLKLAVERQTPLGKKRAFTCKTKVFDQPWTETREVVEFKCNNKD